MSRLPDQTDPAYSIQSGLLAEVHTRERTPDMPHHTCKPITERDLSSTYPCTTRCVCTPNPSTLKRMVWPVRK